MFLLKQNHKKTFFVILLLTLLMLPAVFPLLRDGFFVSDDGEWMIIRFSAFYESLRDGQFPVRLLQRLNQGYGYPVSNFLYPGFMYLGVPLHIIGFSFTETIKLLMAVSIIGSVYFMYLWLRRFFPEFPSVIGSLYYGYAPYHLYDLYIRGSLGELLSLAVIPFIFWQIERKSIFWASLGVGMLILSHNILAVFFFSLVIFYMVFKIAMGENKREILLRNLLVCAIGLGLATFFWLPALYDLRYTVFGQTTISNWAEYFSSISLVGVTTYLVFTLTLLLFLRKKVKVTSHRLTILFLFVGLFATFFATSGSTVLWQILPVSFVQFPFRFLSVVIIAGAFLTAFLIAEFSRRDRIIVLAIFIPFTTFSSWQVLSTLKQTDKPDSYYATNLDTTTVQKEYMPKWVKNHPLAWSAEKVTTERGKIVDIKTSPNTISFITDGKSQAEYVVQKVYFPGWETSMDGKTVTTNYQNSEGLIAVNVPSGRHSVTVSYGETSHRLVSDIISVISILVLFVVGFFQRKKLIK